MTSLLHVHASISCAGLLLVNLPKASRLSTAKKKKKKKYSQMMKFRQVSIYISFFQGFPADEASS